MLTLGVRGRLLVPVVRMMRELDVCGCSLVGIALHCAQVRAVRGEG
jgi:hypothetical protein